MAMALRDIAKFLGGRLQGDGWLVISGAAIIRDAREGDITLADNPKLASQIAQSKASAVIVSDNFTPEGIPYIVVDNVHAAFATLIEKLRPERTVANPGINATAEVDPSAVVHPTAFVGANVKIAPRVVVGEHVSIEEGCVLHAGAQVMRGCQLGRQVELFPNVVLYENTKLGDRVVVHAGSVLGAYGFGYERTGGHFRRSAQLGWVEVANDVEIGACTTIDRGTYGHTYIGEGTKIDNQVMIAHNCRIGRQNLICSHVGIAGSATTGDYVVLAGQAGVRDHVHIGDRSIICAQAGVMNDVPPGVTLVGSPAIPEREQMLVWAASYKLPEMRKELKRLQKMIETHQEALSEPATERITEEPNNGHATNGLNGAHFRSRIDTSHSRSEKATEFVD